MAKSRGVLVAGNWKMNHSLKETEEFFSKLRELSHSYLNSDAIQRITGGKLRACLIPSFIALDRARSQGQSLSFPLHVAAQNAHWEKKGAFTGEVSGPMLQELGIQWVLTGHSERRQFFGETDATVRKRSESLLEQGFQVIFCIGETRAEREAGKTAEVLTRQLNEGLPDSEACLNFIKQGKLTLAYEPVWAIGTGLTATPGQAEECHHLIRDLLNKRMAPEAANQVAVLYGGSVTPENIESLLACPNVDGALVGGASLKPESFLALLKAGATAV